LNKNQIWLGMINSAVLTFIVYEQTDTQAKYMYTRLLGRFALFFYFNCERVLIVKIKKQRKKEFRGYMKKMRIFKIWNLFK